MCILSEEGEMRAEISDDYLIPGAMGSGTYTVTKGKIYALG